ncbi:MAG: argininosuccinate synthase, partial [Chloroflexi bacterium]|nr:argininosuccinate synthase [Chloroflexota bacterium]
DRTAGYQWMEENLPVCGDGVTHYYMQGPVMTEGVDMWDPEETVNLKDKGAVKGTDIKDLCDLVGGMGSGDEVVLRAIDGWYIKFKFANIYQPEDRQGVIALCWYNAEEAQAGESYGAGYPGNDSYYSALQIVIMARTTNSEGKYVFGNSDMRAVLPPEEGYSHFYEGQYPSTNGLSGKWIDEIRVYTGGAPSSIVDIGTDEVPGETSGKIPWISVVLGVAGLLLVGLAIFIATRKKGSALPPAGGA